jgi:DNA mismatch repair ATPase MutL
MLASIKGLIPRLIDEWIGEFGCKSAYKFNDNLKLEEAKLLIANLGKCSFPWHCVHGRTTIHVKYWPSPGI